MHYGHRAETLVVRALEQARPRDSWSSSSTDSLPNIQGSEPDPEPAGSFSGKYFLPQEPWNSFVVHLAMRVLQEL